MLVPNKLLAGVTSPAPAASPQYGLVLYVQSSGNSSYEALLARYEHRIAPGLNFRIEYAFAKALTDSWQSSLTIQQISDCRACAKGPATFDVRHRAVASLVWNLPFGRSQRFGRNMPGWADMAAGGWILSAVTTFASGQPVILTAPNQTGSAFTNPLPDRVCDGRDSRITFATMECYGSTQPAFRCRRSDISAIAGPRFSTVPV